MVEEAKPTTANSTSPKTAESLRDAAFGAVFGALIGDAIGAPLEFSPRPSLARVKEAFTLPGGGIVKVGPGQITDDGELSISLLRGLINGKTHIILKPHST
mmetsp:Transcript_3908/g.4294  ORF Transcript_3908/g.4294 Transcript_3908/m.4294 type:complete len:101 (-) Transcript_3908:766-1068(-)